MLNIFVSGLAYDSGQSGISDYIEHAVAELVWENQVVLFLMEEDEEIYPVEHQNLEIKTVPNWLGFPVLNMIWHLLVLPFRIRKMEVDCIFLPAGNRRLLGFYPYFTIVTFHDLSQFHISGKYDPWRMFYIKNVVPHFLKKADSIMAISKNTKQDMLEFYEIPESQITVNYNGYDNQLFQPEGPGQNNRILNKDYFLYLARIEHPGKNHLRLIKAYERLPLQIKDRYDLFLPGKVWSGGDVVVDYVENSPDRDKIHLPGFITSQQLPQLYRQASLYIFPSLYEGFGIPLIEAMASGVPAICSNTSSLPEIGGSAVVTFDPQNIDAIKNSILQVIEDENKQKQMAQKGLERAKIFSWKKHAETILEEFENNI